jgi:signal peptidase II
MAYITAGLVFALDQATKYAVVHGLGLAQRLSIDVVPPYLNFRMAWNRGVNFGLFSSDVEVMRWVLVAIALAVSVWVWVWARAEVRAAGGGAPRVQISAGLLVGGALGNVVDRLIYGAVADFLNMSCCGIRNPFSFNIADAAIFLGAVGLVVFTAAPRKTP